jgi:tetratricopeptide (TPR) repeat protein
LAKCRFERGACEAAGEALDRALALSPDADTLDARAACALQAGRPDVAEPLLRRALEASPTHVAARVRLGRLRVDAGAPADALPHFDVALGVEPGNADALYFSALCLRAAKRAEEALTRVDMLAAAVPGHVGAVQLRASLLRTLGRKEASDAAYAELRRLVAEDDALSTELAALRIGPPDAARRAKAAARALDLGRFDIAGEQLRAATALDPRLAELPALFARLERSRSGAASRPSAPR